MRTLLFLSGLVFFACSNGQNSPAEIPQKALQASASGYSKKITAPEGYKPGDKCFGGMTLCDEAGRAIEEYDYSSCEVLFKKTTFKYEKDRVISSHIESRFENVDYDWQYDEAGRLTAQIARKPTTHFQYKLAYSYDAAGNQTEYVGTMADGSPFPGTAKKTFSYENGRKVKTLCYGPGEEAGYRIVHLYDEKGREIGGHIYKDPKSEEYEVTGVFYLDE